MNKFILEQLNKTKILLPPYTSETTELRINKSGLVVIPNDFNVGQTYNICVDDYIINEPDNFSLSMNWNNGTKPKEPRMLVQIIQINGKMIKVSAVGVNSMWSWVGWLPKKSIHIL